MLFLDAGMREQFADKTNNPLHTTLFFQNSSHFLACWQ